jgi:hypothetical protein
MDILTITTGWSPPVISWFINHEIITMNYGYIYHKPLNSATYKPTERYLGGPTL